MRHLRIIGLIVGAAILAPIPTAAMPKIGSDCVLGKRAALAHTPETAGEVDQAIRMSNSGNLDALVASGKVIVVADGPTSARIINVNSTWGAMKVRVLGGALRGSEGWLVAGMCDPP